MLTESEKQWLERREEMPGYFCLWCPLWDNEADCDGRSPHPFCPIFQRRERLLDAAEFSERVAAKLANIHFGTEDCQYCSNHINVNEYCGECKTASSDKRCLACRLKYARLKVEEEMDSNGQ